MHRVLFARLAKFFDLDVTTGRLRRLVIPHLALGAGKRNRFSRFTPAARLHLVTVTQGSS